MIIASKKTTQKIILLFVIFAVLLPVTPVHGLTQAERDRVAVLNTEIDRLSRLIANGRDFLQSIEGAIETEGDTFTVSWGWGLLNIVNPLNWGEEIGQAIFGDDVSVRSLGEARDRAESQIRSDESELQDVIAERDAILFGSGGGLRLSVPIPNIENPGATVTNVSTISEYVKTAYTFSIVLAAFFAIIFIVYAAIQFIISRGDTGKIMDARDRITSSIYGLLLLIGAALILGTISPSITKLEVSSSGPSNPQAELNEYRNIKNRIDSILDRIGGPQTIVLPTDRLTGTINSSQIKSLADYEAILPWVDTGTLVPLIAEIEADLASPGPLDGPQDDPTSVIALKTEAYDIVKSYRSETSDGLRNKYQQLVTENSGLPAPNSIVAASAAGWLPQARDLLERVERFRDFDLELGGIRIASAPAMVGRLEFLEGSYGYWYRFNARRAIWQGEQDQEKRRLFEAYLTSRGVDPGQYDDYRSDSEVTGKPYLDEDNGTLANETHNYVDANLPEAYKDANSPGKKADVCLEKEIEELRNFAISLGKNPDNTYEPEDLKAEKRTFSPQGGFTTLFSITEDPATESAWLAYWAGKRPADCAEYDYKFKNRYSRLG